MEVTAILGEWLKIEMVITIILIMIGIPTIIITGFFAALGLAKKNLFFTLVEEGTAKAIMSFGGFQKIIFQYRGKKMTAEGDIKNLPNEEQQETFWKKQIGGLRWLGIPGLKSLYVYKKPQSGEIVERDRDQDYILLKNDVYLAVVKSAEADEMVPLDVQLLITTQCINPYKALFGVQDWLEMIINRSEATFRQYVAEFTFEDLVSNRQSAGKELKKRLERSQLLEQFRGTYGIEIISIEMKDIDPAGAGKKAIEEAATKQWVAKQEAKSIAELATAESKKIKKIYGEIQNFGELGAVLRYLESIDKAGAKQGNWIIPLDISKLKGRQK